MSRRDRIRIWLLHKLGIRLCGAFGGMHIAPYLPVNQQQRWCTKPYGHTDSCAYDLLPNLPSSQPGFALRQRFKGWDDN